MLRIWLCVNLFICGYCLISPLGLDQFKFFNLGSVNSTDRFHLVELTGGPYYEGHLYQDDPLNNNNLHVKNALIWLYQIDTNGSSTLSSAPPPGMRSEVPFS